VLFVLKFEGVFRKKKVNPKKLKGVVFFIIYSIDLKKTKMVMFA